MARRSSRHRPGSQIYAKLRRAELRRIEVLAEATAARAKRPEARRKAQQRATRARAAIKKIEAREEIRRSLTNYTLEAFNRSTLQQQDFELLVRRIERQYPNGVPPDVPDPFASAGPLRGKTWSVYYSRQGMRRKNAAD